MYTCKGEREREEVREKEDALLSSVIEAFKGYNNKALLSSCIAYMVCTL